MEFITRANFGMVIGNFELDLSDGDLRFKVSTQVPPGTDLGAIPHFARLYGRLIGSNLSMMDRYRPGIEAVLKGTPPAEAIKAIEGK